jgi:hypothetical protein
MVMTRELSAILGLQMRAQPGPITGLQSSGPDDLAKRTLVKVPHQIYKSDV